MSFQFDKQIIHYWGLLHNLEKGVEIMECLIAPTNMRLLINDTVDFNNDSFSDLEIKWSYLHHNNHEFSTGKQEKSGVCIWDVKNALNLIDLTLRANGSSWNMCRGGSSAYNVKYYDYNSDGYTLHLKKYEGEKVVVNKKYFWLNGRFVGL